MLNLPKTRQEARDLGLKAYFTGLFCKQGHIQKRWVATGNCSECQKQRSKNWADKNPEKVKAYFQLPEMLEKRRFYGRTYYEKNKLFYIQKDADRRAKKLQAQTIWGQENVSKFYKKAKELELLNPGIKYHVDHVVPLVGKNVCGLHNQFNLQILTETENKRKGNVWN